jgi:hypothetical protein
MGLCTLPGSLHLLLPEGFACVESGECVLAAGGVGAFCVPAWWAAKALRVVSLEVRHTRR